MFILQAQLEEKIEPGILFVLIYLEQALAQSLACTIKSATGTRTRVARVRAEYPNQLDYSGLMSGAEKTYLEGSITACCSSLAKRDTQCR